MGDWAIVVHGTGAHHNADYATDADRMTQRFVDDLIRAGHQVNLATFTAGGRTVLDTVDNLAQHRNAIYHGQGDPLLVVEDVKARSYAHGTLGLPLSKRRDPFIPG